MASESVDPARGLLGEWCRGTAKHVVPTTRGVDAD